VSEEVNRKLPARNMTIQHFTSILTPHYRQTQMDRQTTLWSEQQIGKKKLLVHTTRSLVHSI